MLEEAKAAAQKEAGELRANLREVEKSRMEARRELQELRRQASAHGSWTHAHQVTLLSQLHQPPQTPTQSAPGTSPPENFLTAMPPCGLPIRATERVPLLLEYIQEEMAMHSSTRLSGRTGGSWRPPGMPATPGVRPGLQFPGW